MEGKFVCRLCYGWTFCSLLVQSDALHVVWPHCVPTTWLVICLWINCILFVNLCSAPCRKICTTMKALSTLSPVKEIGQRIARAPCLWQPDELKELYYCNSHVLRLGSPYDKRMSGKCHERQRMQGIWMRWDTRAARFWTWSPSVRC